MNSVGKNLLRKNEFYIAIVIVIVCILIQARSGQFFTSNNIVDQMNAVIVSGIFAVGTFMVLISGGIDVSFPALATLSVYIVVDYTERTGYDGNVILPLLCIIGLGAAFGALNGVFAAKFNVSTLIITLGTSSVFRGILQGMLNARIISVIPKCYTDVGDATLFSVANEETGLVSNMPAVFLVLVAVVAVAFIILRYTYFGRSIYAIGGDENAATRAGFNVFKTKLMLYVVAGMIASVGAFVRTCQIHMMMPTNLLGMEMMVIAAVVLGGTAITGGKGTLTGAILGTVLISIVQNSLILLGVPTFWQTFFIGILIIVGTAVSSLQLTGGNGKARKSLPKNKISGRAGK